jgi:hypothetical protein
MNKNSTKPPVIDAGGNISRSSIEAALTRWQEQRKQLELSIVATNTVIAELTTLLNPPKEDKP